MRVSFVWFLLVVIPHLQSILMHTGKLCVIRHITGLWRNIRPSSTVPELKRCMEICWGAVVGLAGMTRLLPLTQTGKVLLTLDEDLQLYLTRDASHRRPACLPSTINSPFKLLSVKSSFWNRLPSSMKFILNFMWQKTERSQNKIIFLTLDWP